MGPLLARWAGSLLALVAGGALVAMMLVTVLDVGLRAGLNLPLRGTIEVVELLLAVSFFVALPLVFLRDANIVVDVLDSRLPPRSLATLRAAAGLLGALTLGFLCWRGVVAAEDTLVFGDVTADLAWPRIWYWVPVLFGLGAAALAALPLAQRPGGR